VVVGRSLRLWSSVDIRTKLIFALVAVSLASMFALSAAVEPRVSGFLTDATVARLEELADAKTRMIGLVVDGWRQRAEAIASRPPLRAGLDAIESAGQSGDVVQLQSVLEDAVGSYAGVWELRVYGAGGGLVASFARGGPRGGPSVAEPSRALSPPEEATYLGVEWTEAGFPRIAFATAIAIGARTVGTLVSVFDAPEIRELVGGDTRLGSSGETLVFAEGPDGLPRTLHPTRYRAEAVGGVPLPSGPEGLATRTLSRRPGQVDSTEDVASTGGAGVNDYRGERVWAATRLVAETGWGLIVKVDAREEEAVQAEFRSWLRRTALILAAFAILAGFLLGLRFALPIHALAEAANEIRSGNLSARAKVASEDEVGVLTRTFNEMAEALEDRVGILHEFRKFFDVSIDLMCIANTDGYFKRVNPAFVRVLGWSEEELLARPFFDFIHADDIAKTEREVAKLMGGTPTISFENRFVCRDGTCRLLRWTSFPDQGVLYAIARVMDESVSV